MIEAPTFTGSKGKAGDAELQTSKKCNQPYFGMKAHIGPDAESILIHAVHSPSGCVSDITEANTLLYREKTLVFGDAG